MKAGRLLAAAVLLGIAVAPQGAGQDSGYAGAFSRTMTAADSGAICEHYTSLMRSYRDGGGPRAVEVGLTTLCAWELCGQGAASVPRSGISLEDGRRALRIAMEKDEESAYPILAYAWFSRTYRDPKLSPEPEYSNVGTGHAKINGEDVAIPVRRIVADPALDKLVNGLLHKAAALEPSNPLLLYLRGLQATEPTEKRRLLWASLGSPGARLWEFRALLRLRDMAGGDDAELQRIHGWAAKAKAVVGDSPRARANGF